MKLSVVISAYNEERMIEDCLKSARFADEIILVDNQSTDKTTEIAKRYTNKIFFRTNNPLMLNLNKNFGFTKATGDWILSLDADERVSKELKEEINNISISHQPSVISNQAISSPAKTSSSVSGFNTASGTPMISFASSAKEKANSPGNTIMNWLKSKEKWGNLKTTSSISTTSRLTST